MRLAMTAPQGSRRGSIKLVDIGWSLAGARPPDGGLGAKTSLVRFAELPKSRPALGICPALSSPYPPCSKLHRHSIRVS